MYSTDIFTGVDKQREQCKKYYVKNRQKVLDYQKEYRKNNCDKIKATKQKRADKVKAYNKEYGKKRYKRNRELLLKKAAEWRSKNKAKIAEFKRGWRIRNKQKVYSQNANRRGVKRAAEGKYNHDDVTRILKLQGNKCALCSTGLEELFHRDHIVPLSKGGSNAPKNIQVLCSFCNISKGNKDQIDFMRLRGFLL